jgi:hypothetical protein
MKSCCRCENAAGFWVMAKDAQVARRPWCLPCIDEFLDKGEVKLARIEREPVASHSPVASVPSARAGHQDLRQDGRYRHQG